MLFWVTYLLVVHFAFPLYIFIYSARASIQKGHKSMLSLSAVDEGDTYLLFPPSQYFPLEGLKQRGVHCTWRIWKEQISVPGRSCEESCSLAVWLDNPHNCLSRCVPGMILSVQRAAQVQQNPLSCVGTFKRTSHTPILCCTWCYTGVHRDQAALEYSVL